MSSPGVHARYNNRDRGGRDGRRRLLLVGALLAVVAAAWVLWAGLHVATTDPGLVSVSYQVVDDSSVQVRYQLQLSRSAPTVCVLEAKDGDQAVVGQRTVTLPARPTGDLSVTRRDVVRTTRRAVTAAADSCVRR